MGLLIAAALGVIAFLLVEGTRAKATAPPPPTGAAGASAGDAGLSDTSWLSDPTIPTPLAPARPSQQMFDAGLAGQTVDLTQLSPEEAANYVTLWQQYYGS